MRIAILGFGREGQSLLTYLNNNRRYRDADTTVLDKNSAVKVPRGVSLVGGKNYLKDLAQYDVIFRSPGIPYHLPEFRAAAKKGVEISSATKLFFENCPCPIIAITGTKGKTGTATLIYEILKAGKKDVRLGGNIGVPALNMLPKLHKKSLVVLELSSFQLQDLETSPHVAVVTETFPDHQDVHKNLAEYYRAKIAIARYQNSKDLVFYFLNNNKGKWIASHGIGKKIAVSEKEFSLFKPEDLKVRGAHNYKNAVMGARVAEALGISRDTIRHTVMNFRGVPHRLEFVRKAGNISFYNDSASTTPHSLAATITAFPGVPLAVIAGGKDKNLDYAPVKKAVYSKAAKQLQVIVLIGENKNKIARAIGKATSKIIYSRNLNDAIHEAYRTVRARGTKSTNGTKNAGNVNGVVVLSPGAASFDMFKNYADRGEQFRTIVRSIK
ncbi:MAG: UDP-N-acetylmuramoyl-L-alanine--D-glutamate ligase [Candidatus Liptonbacteria bacterium]